MKATEHFQIVRSLVDQIEGKSKTETSRKPLLMSDELVPTLTLGGSKPAYAKSADWVFARRVSFEKLPFWPDMVLRRVILPAAKRLGIYKRMGETLSGVPPQNETQSQSLSDLPCNH